MSLIRLTKEHKDKLTRFYGSSEWETIFKRGPRRDAELLEFYINNLRKVGFSEIKNKQIRRQLRFGKKLYQLILASHHKVATKIVDSIFSKQLDGQLTLL